MSQVSFEGPKKLESLNCPPSPQPPSLSISGLQSCRKGRTNRERWPLKPAKWTIISRAPKPSDCKIRKGEEREVEGEGVAGRGWQDCAAILPCVAGEGG